MIEIINGSKKYSNNNKSFFALNRINIMIEQKDMVAIVGASGSGKTTLLKIIAGYEFFDSGRYLFKGKKIEKLDKDKLHQNEFGMVFQDYQLLDYLTVKENILLACYYSKRKPDNKELMKITKELKIEPLLQKHINQLSGGEKQRIAIARILLSNKSIILADEPTGALDRKSADKIMDIFEELNQRGKTIIIVTHDESIAKRCKRIIRLDNGYVSATVI